MTIFEDGFDLPGLVVPAFSYVADPNFADSTEIEYAKVDLHHPTHDPNRVTIHVPSEATVLALGAASPTWKTDAGITGYTSNHVHFETKVNAKTVVSLGSSATTAEIKGQGGEPPVETQGYAMVTSKIAWQESASQHYVLSREKDVVFSSMGPGKRAVVQATKGFVDVNGGEEVTLSGGGVAIGGASGLKLEPVPYAGAFHGDAPTSASAKTGKNWMDRVAALYSIHDLGLKAYKMVKKGVPKDSTNIDYFFADVIKWTGDAIKFGMSLNKIIKVFTHPSSPDGCVKIGAESDVAGVAGLDASFSGLVGASIASVGATAVSAGVMATLKGTLFAGVGSVLTGIKAQKNMEVSSTWGDVVFSAKKNVEFTADEELAIGVKGNAQINAEQKLLFGGKTRTFLGIEPGWGVLFDDKGIAFGKASGMADLTSATIDDKPAIRIDSDGILIASPNSSIKLTNDAAIFEGPSIHLDAKQKKKVFLNGKRIRAK